MQLFNLDKINKIEGIGEFTMDSHEFLKTVINKVRKENGEDGLRHNQFIKQIEDEFSKQISIGAGPSVYQKMVDRGERPDGSKILIETKVYELNHKQMVIMGMRSSKVVREIVYDLIVELKKNHDALVDGILEVQTRAVKNKKFLDGINTEDSNIRNAMVISTFRLLWESGNIKLAMRSLDNNPHLTNFLLEAVGYKDN